jgi:Xaa-Pro dipeptidase
MAIEVAKGVRMAATEPRVEIPFSVEEYHRRLARTRERMRERGVRAMICNEPENIYYLTGYKTIGYYWYQCVLVTEDHDPVIVLRKFEESNVLFGTWSRQLAPYMDYEDPVQTTVNALSDLGIADGATIGVEKRNWFLTVHAYEGFQRLLPNAKFVDCSDLVEKLRAVKSEEELRYSREAARIASLATIAGIEAVQAGKTENDLAAAVWAGLLKHGSEEPAIAPFVLSGERTYLAHQTWAGRTLRQGDVIYFEIAAKRQMYHGAQMRSGTIGPPSDEVRRMCEASIGALDAAIPLMKPGAISQDVDKAARDVVNKAGFGEYFRHRLAYSIGIKYPPDWGEGHIISLKPHDESVLQAGMVFHLVPVFLVYGKYGVGFSETVLVTDNGGEPLTTAPREAFVR